MELPTENLIRKLAGLYLGLSDYVINALVQVYQHEFAYFSGSFCKDTIKAIYGADSEELDRFNKAIRS